MFRNWILDAPAGHRWYRFCGDSRFRDLAFNVMAVQLTTMGIPCVYYGSEQGFDSGGRPNGSDLVLRENMFGGRFGSFCTQGRHFFNEDGGLYRALAALIDLRKKLLPLRRGRQTLHHISGDGVTFGLPHRLGDRMRSLVSWSRLFIDQEVLIAMNTDEAEPVTAYSTVAPTFRLEGDQFHLIFWYAPKSAAPPPADFDCGTYQWAACRSDDTAAGGLCNLPGGPWPWPPGSQPAPGLEGVATTCGSRLTAGGDCKPCTRKSQA